MKTYAVIMLIVLCPFFPVQADIINAYVIEKQKLEKKIQSSLVLQETAGTDKSTKQIEKGLKRLQKEYEIVARKYTDTENLIATIRQIDPELYETVSKVTNAEGTLTHVYVRCAYRTDEELIYFINKHFNAMAYTSVRPSDTNENVCYSQFGINTIMITVKKCHDEIIALAHEFAHVLYVVPNLKNYAAFIRKESYKYENNRFGPGHKEFDPSRDFVKSLEKRFKDKYLKYVNNFKGERVL